MSPNTFLKSVVFTLILWFSTDIVSAQVSQKIGGNPYSIDPKAVLELESTTKGFLLPRMTNAQMTAITTPTEGMMVYCTDCGVGTDGELRIAYNSVWQTFKGNLTGNITGNAATVTTNSNLTGPITSTGNTTAVASQTGTGSKFVMDTAPTLVTPVLGVATATSVNGTSIPTSKTLVVTTDKLSALSATTSAELAGVVSDETGTGSVVLAVSPALTGTPTAPTATAGTNTTQLATTAFVKAVASSSNFVDLTTNQTVAGAKTFNDNLIVNGINVGTGNSDNTNNTALGIATLSSNTGTYNTAIGESSLASNTTGNYNTAIGTSSLVNNTTGVENTVIGSESLTSNISGNYNTAVGRYSLRYNTASNNTGVGMNSSEKNTAGVYNSAFGVQALQANTVGNNNTAIGAAAIDQITTGNDNVAIGFAAGRYISNGITNNTTLNNSVLIGANTRVNAVGETNQIVIGHGAIGNGSNTVQLGNTSITNVKTSGTLTADAVTYPKAHGTSGQVLSTTGSGTLVWVTASVIDVADEFTANAAQTSFTLTQTPSVNSIVKMYVNGIRISKTAFTVSGTTLTYIPANNGSYALSVSDRIQFDYFK